MSADARTAAKAKRQVAKVSAARCTFAGPPRCDRFALEGQSFCTVHDPNKPPSAYVAPSFPRTQAEELLTLLRAQPQKRWKPHIRNLLAGLRHNANGKVYL